jgi:large-conductance mechanosensitive channel
MGFIKEFKEFAVKGNLVDIAIAFVMAVHLAKWFLPLQKKWWHQLLDYSPTVKI